MKRLAALLAGLLFCASFAKAEIGEELNAIFARNETLGACVAVFENGDITFTHCYGRLSPGGEEVSENTLFQVGSISKMTANIGLLQLMEKHQLSLDSAIGDVLGFAIAHPNLPDEPITFRQLMTHTAGLRDGMEYQNALLGKPKRLSVLFREYRASVFDFELVPGKQRQYSNFGGGLIGALIEKLSGQTVDAYLYENVFEPLGVTAAYQIGLLPESLPTADIYHMPKKEIGKKLRGDESLITEADAEKHYAYTAGRLIISAPDLCKILIALCDGGIYENTRILPESAVEEMITPQNFRGSVNCESGHGLFLNILKDVQVEGRTLYGHGGKAYGMLCAAYFDPADRTGVVMLTNGCRDRTTYGGVGYLGREILTCCYRKLIEPAHETINPFLVE